MAGITLSADEIRSAPPEIRAWIEEQLAAAFAASRPEPAQPVSRALAVCGAEEVRAILVQVQSLLPVVSVFFELGRDGPTGAGQPTRVFSVAEIQKFAHLRAPEQVMQCVEVLNQVVRQIRGDTKAVLCAADPSGHCYVAEATSRAIRALWHEIVAERAAQPVAEQAPAMA